jgi:uncharacterized phage protein gp47/JayE
MKVSLRSAVVPDASVPIALMAEEKIGSFERGFWRVFLNYEAMPDQTTGELVSFFGSGGYTALRPSKWLN